MSKSNAATVIDLDAYRQRKQEEERSVPSGSEMTQASFAVGAQPLFVPVWFCWVPAWGPVVG